MSSLKQTFSQHDTMIMKQVPSQMYTKVYLNSQENGLFLGLTLASFGMCLC